MATKAEKGRVSIMTKQQKKTLNLVLTYLVIILIGCVLLFPIAWMISAAFKTNDEIFGSIALMPKSFSFQNFIDGWKSAGIYTYATYFINSFIMVIPTTLLTIASSALVAYGFARFNFPFKKQLFAILIATLMLPNSVIIIPRYVLFKQVRLGRFLHAILGARPAGLLPILHLSAHSVHARHPPRSGRICLH